MDIQNKSEWKFNMLYFWKSDEFIYIYLFIYLYFLLQIISSLSSQPLPKVWP
jgi:hypothetical protein